jgi:hypothetical protein
MVESLIHRETGGTGDCTLEGGSGEKGCLQYMPDVWEYYSNKVLGYTPEQTEVNEKYVAVRMVEYWLDGRYEIEDIPLLWNGGSTKIKKGVNRWGIRYDTEAYQLAVLNHFNQ